MKRAIVLIWVVFAGAWVITAASLTLWPQEKKPDFIVLAPNDTSNISVIASMKKGLRVEIIYIDRLGEKDERRGIIRIYDKDDKLIVDVDENGKAVYGEGHAAND